MYFTLNISLQDTVKKAWSHDGYYSVVGIKIDLVSRYRKYLFVYFIPTTMFTLTSWVSYLLPPTSYPARTSLLVTVFLCQVGIFTAAIKDTPNFDGGLRKLLQRWTNPSFFCDLGMTSLELWCFACITCTFGALLSYVIILIRMEYVRQWNKNVIKTTTTEGKLASKSDAAAGLNKHELKRDINIEVFLFTCVAVGFALFNLVYWVAGH